MTQRPKPGTDNARFLDALIAAHPGWVSRPNSRLNIMAHSRASDLRDMGYRIEAKRFPDPDRPRKPDYRYRLTELPEHATVVVFDQDGQGRLSA